MGILQSDKGTYSGTGPITVTLPNPTSSSSKIVVAILGDGTVGTPSGWELRDDNVGYDGAYFFEHAGGATSWDFTPGSAANYTWVAFELDNGVFDAVALSAYTNTSDITWATNGVTPTAGERVLIALVGHISPGATGHSVTSWSDSFVEVADQQVAAGDNPLGAVATRTVTADGVATYSTTATFSAAGDGRVGLLIAYASSSSALAVSAGADQAILTTGTAALSATATGGSGTKTYTWTKVNGPAGTFSAPSSASTTFTPSGGAGTYTLRCIVTDASGTAQDDVVVTVTTPPTLVRLATIESSTGWTPTPSGSTVLAVLSDSDDATLITSTDNPTNVAFDGYLPAMQPPAADQARRIRVRCDRPGASSGTVTGKLYEGATLRSTVSAAIPAALADVDLDFPVADLAAIASSSWTTVVTGTRTAMRLVLSFTAAV